jgi:predicted nucleic acid-binding protein
MAEWLNVVKLSLKKQTEAGAWQASRMLHAGEAEAFVLSKQKNAEWFLTDDAATRLLVSVLSTEIRGSSGAVLRNAAKRHINGEETEEALDGLRQSSLRLSENIYNEA